MATRIPYETVREEQDDTIESSKSPDGMSWKEAEIEEVRFRQDNRLILIICALLFFIFLGSAPYVAAWTGNDAWGYVTCIGGIGCTWVLTYYLFLRWKRNKGQ